MFALQDFPGEVTPREKRGAVALRIGMENLTARLRCPEDPLSEPFDRCKIHEACRGVVPGEKDDSFSRGIEGV